MSSDDASFSSTWAGLPLLGGLSSRSQDLAPSILFALAFAALVPLAVLRIGNRATRTSLLYRIVAAVVLRVATYSLRAVEATGEMKRGMRTAEQILLLTAPSLLYEPLLPLLRYHVRRNWIPSVPSSQETTKVTWLERALYVLWLTAWASLVLGIVAGSEAYSASTAKLKRYRYAGIALTLLILGLSLLICGAMHVRERLPARGTAFLLACNGLLVVPTLYRLISTLSPPAPTSAAGKAVFYILFSAPELLVALLWFVVDLQRMFRVREGEWKEVVERKMRKGRWEGEFVGREEWELREKERSDAKEEDV
ncbi:hypothetical protein JCM10213_006217 [Rhodosporidiobolus nylandii]